ncbi:MAG TPA: MFS transporter [Novosphingobium sp.]|nr:MFS transporter [Novosphingobium sp.]
MIDANLPVPGASDPRQLLLDAPMSKFQWRAVAMTIALCALDGFDVFAVTFAAPALLRDWGIGRGELGLALSAGLLGMALGSLLLSPLADTFGRRRMLFVALAIMVIGTTWTATVEGLGGLIASRLFTGAGIGAMIAVIMPLAAEYANARRRDLAVSLFAIGFPLGGIIGGFVSAYLLAEFGWRSIFVAASGIGLVMAVLSARTLFDPVALVIARPGNDGLARVNKFLARCGHAAIAALPPAPTSTKVPIGRLFETGMLRTTVQITLIYFLVVIPVFFMQTWLPTLIADLGIAPSKAALISAFFSIGGVIAGLAIAATATRFGLRASLNLALIGGGLMIVLFSRLSANVPLLIVAAGVAGFFVQGAMVALYAVLARTFPVEMRASGSGFVIGIGRVGSILPPLLAGVLAAAGLDRTGIAIVMAAPVIAALVLLAGFVIRPPTTA